MRRCADPITVFAGSCGARDDDDPRPPLPAFLAAAAGLFWLEEDGLFWLAEDGRPAGAAAFGWRRFWNCGENV